MSVLGCLSDAEAAKQVLEGAYELPLGMGPAARQLLERMAPIQECRNKAVNNAGRWSVSAPCLLSWGFTLATGKQPQAAICFPRSMQSSRKSWHRLGALQSDGSKDCQLCSKRNLVCDCQRC